MTNATDVIAYLLPRKAAPIVERQTGLPFGWGLWLRALPERLGRITCERADAAVARLGLLVLGRVALHLVLHVE